MSLPNEVQSILEDRFEEEMEHLIKQGYDASVAAKIAEQRVWQRRDEGRSDFVRHAR